MKVPSFLKKQYFYGHVLFGTSVSCYETHNTGKIEEKCYLLVSYGTIWRLMDYWLSIHSWLYLCLYTEFLSTNILNFSREYCLFTL